MNLRAYIPLAVIRGIFCAAVLPLVFPPSFVCACSRANVDKTQQVTQPSCCAHKAPQSPPCGETSTASRNACRSHCPCCDRTKSPIPSTVSIRREQTSPDHETAYAVNLVGSPILPAIRHASIGDLSPDTLQPPARILFGHWRN